jgi:hypothetical protein
MHIPHGHFEPGIPQGVPAKSADKEPLGQVTVISTDPQSEDRWATDSKKAPVD